MLHSTPAIREAERLRTWRLEQAARASSPSPAFEKLVALSGWFLLAMEDQRDPNKEDAEAMVRVAGEETPPFHGQSKEKTTPWRRWRRLEGWSEEGLSRKLGAEILPDLERCFPPDDGSPLGLVPKAFADLPAEVLREALDWTLALDDDSTHGGDDLPWQEMSERWTAWEDAARYATNKDYRFDDTGLEVADFLAETLRPTHRGVSYHDTHAGTGQTAAAFAKCAPAGLQITLHESSSAAALIAAARVRLVMGPKRPSLLRIFTAHSLEPVDARGQFDLVVSCPPWGARRAEAVPASHAYPVPTRSEELSHLQHALLSLTPGGLAAVAVPARFLFGDGPDRRVREWMLNEFRLEAVVNLSAGALRTNTSIPGAILFVRRAAPGRDVWFVTAEQFQAATDGRTFTEADVDYELFIAALRSRLGLAAEVGKSSFAEWLERLAAKTEAPGFFESAGAEGGRWLQENARRLLGLARAFQNRTATDDPSVVSVATLLRRNAELLFKDGPPQDLDALLADLSKFRPGSRITSLAEIAEVISGVTYSSRELIEREKLPRRLPSGAVGLARVTDLPKLPPDASAVPVLRDVSRYFGEEPREKAKGEHRLLQPGDILLSVGGTVGRVALCDEDLPARVLPSNGVTVIRLQDRTFAPYVAALLTSESYTAWMQGESTGSVIQHLSLKMLRRLKIVLPRKEEIAELLAALGTRASETRLRDTFGRTPGALSPLTRFVLGSREFQRIGRWRSGTGGTVSAEDIKALRAAVEVSRNLSPTVLDTEPEGSRKAAFKELLRLALDLLELLELEGSVDRFAAIQAWAARAKDEGSVERAKPAILRLLSSIEVHSPALSPAEKEAVASLRAFHHGLIRLAGTAVDTQLRVIDVMASVKPTVLTVAQPTELIFSLVNQGALALRKLKVRTDGAVQTSFTSVLFAGSSRREWSAAFNAPEAGPLRVHVIWEARRLDDTEISGDIELALEAQASPNVALSTDLGTSPYVYARVLDENSDNVFFGRREALRRLRTALGKSLGSTILLVEGNRRTGKTSLLNYFRHHCLPQDWVPVNINFQEFEGDTGSPAQPGIPTRAVFAGMTRELVAAVAAALPGREIPGLGTPPPRGSFLFNRFVLRATQEITEDAPYTSFRDLFFIMREAVRPRRLLLMLDEFDRLQEGIESGVTNDQVPENLRNLFQDCSDIAGIFTGARTLRRLREEYWSALFGFGETVRLRGLEPDEAHALIENPVRGRLVYAPEATAQIMALTARQPLLIQGMCDHLFELCRERKERGVTLAMVTEVATTIAADSEHFEALWGYVRNDRQRFLIFLVDEVQRDRGSATFEDLREAGERHGLRYTTRELERALDDLLDLEVIGNSQGDGTAHYQLEVPLFGIWLRRNKDLGQVRLAALEEE